MKNIKGFTLVELVVVITILAILSVVGFVAYTGQLADSRNAVRVSDMSNIKMALKNHKFKNGSYPLPGRVINITNSGVIIKQGYFDNETYTQEMVKKPIDPFVKKQNYMYSVTNNNLFFQIAMSLEDKNAQNDSLMKAYVDGDYQSLNDGFIPSLVFATQTGGAIMSLSGTSIVDQGTLNLPYDENGIIIHDGATLQQVLGENVNVPKFYGYYSCSEIYDNGASMGSGIYKILNNAGSVTSTGCTF
ncbi:MAG: type IV pilin protein [Candidatus Altimarinota bacterium]